MNGNGEQRACLSTEELPISLVRIELEVEDRQAGDDAQRRMMGTSSGVLKRKIYSSQKKGRVSSAF